VPESLQSQYFLIKKRNGPPWLNKVSLLTFKTNGQLLRVVLFIMLCKMVLTFKSVDETLVCADHSNESC